MPKDYHRRETLRLACHVTPNQVVAWEPNLPCYSETFTLRNGRFVSGNHKGQPIESVPTSYLEFILDRTGADPKTLQLAGGILARRLQKELKEKESSPQQDQTKYVAPSKTQLRTERIASELVANRSNLNASDDIAEFSKRDNTWTKCPICNCDIFRKNIEKHCRKKHPETIAAEPTEQTTASANILILGGWMNIEKPELKFDPTISPQVRFFGHKHWTTCKYDTYMENVEFCYGGDYSLKDDILLTTVRFADEKTKHLIGSEDHFSITFSGEICTQTRIGSAYPIFWHRDNANAIAG